MTALLRDALRGLRSRSGPTAIAVGGMLLAQAVCLLVGLLALALTSMDPNIPEPERVVVLDFKLNVPGEEGESADWPTASPVEFGPLLKARDLPLSWISRTSGEGLTVVMQGRPQLVLVLAADPDLVPLFGLRALHGDLRATLSRRDSIAVTPSLVRKLWGDLPLDQALGRTFDCRGHVYTVTAVIPPPDRRSSDLPYEAMAGYAGVGLEFRGNIADEQALHAIHQVNGRVYARLAPGVAAEQVGPWMREAFRASPQYASLPAAWRSGPDGPREVAFFRAVPLPQLPFENNGLRWGVLAAVGAASALLLLLAAINGMNLQAASLLQRQRETALRRSLGAGPLQLVQLWALEALLPLLASAAGALLLAWWAAPTAANWLELPAEWPVADPLPVVVWPALAGLTALLLVMILTGPALLALRQPPAPALQGRTASEGPGGRRLRQGLLSLQLGGALLLLSLTGVLAQQHRHLLQADRGFETRNRLVLSAVVERDFVPNLDAFVAALKQHPAVEHFAFSTARPAMDLGGPSELHVSAQGQRQMLRMTVVSPDYFATYGMRLLAGTPLSGPGEPHLVIDAKAARVLGFASPQAAVGALLRGGGDLVNEGQEMRRVVAVVGDIKQESAREAALPQAFLLSDAPQWDLTVYGPDPQALRQALDTLWTTVGPPLRHMVWTADEQRAMTYRQEQRLTWILGVVALLAVGVAMLGAYALVADTLRRRRTELVLRRLHGAGHRDIALQVAREFGVPLLAAAAVGGPLAAWVGGVFLGGYVDRVGDLAGLWLPLAAALVATVAVTLLAAWRHVLLALRLRPVEALR